MLHKVRNLAMTVHFSLLELPVLEHRMWGIGLCSVSVLCLIFPKIMEALVQLMGLSAAGAATYILWVLKQREVADDDHS